MQAEAGSNHVASLLTKRQRLNEDSEADNRHTETKDTAWMKCSRTSVHTLQSTSVPVSLVCLQGVDHREAPWVSTNCWEKTVQLLVVQPELKELPQVNTLLAFTCD